MAPPPRFIASEELVTASEVPSTNVDVLMHID
jgi:hypothetical protein